MSSFSDPRRPAATDGLAEGRMHRTAAVPEGAVHRSSPWAAAHCGRDPGESARLCRSTAALEHVFASEGPRRPMLGLAVAASLSALAWGCLLTLLI